MKFVISSTELLNHLQAISRVISNKNTLPILDNFLFQLNEKELKITASDLETTLITTIHLENVTDGGNIAIPARILTDTLKEFPDQPLTFDINNDTFSIVITTENGKYNVVGQNGEDFPQLPSLKKDLKTSVQLPSDVLLNGIVKTLFATADDELRPVMNGIFIELYSDNMTFVASDAHKLVRYKRMDVKSENESSFILPKKPASLLKAILPKEQKQVLIEFDDKNAFFTLSEYKLVSRLVEGNYPSYNSVIPTNNPNKLTIDRLELYNALKRVALFSNQASNLVKLDLKGNQLNVSAQDIDFSISANERLNCQYEGDDMEIGFKSSFLIEILSNLSSTDVVVELSDPSRAGILLPAERENIDEDVLMLIMPMMINV
ncbi:MAG: DNA polymerase III subunit beta [Bacteroidetes bacterium GWC2_33_15]|nr:MAG: DNA polymerase III subunit beta [Bacteroidetes bacterium GWA2_33_15]OFX51069.1 MAG: DNA polymerase III subunit beta [Bacteroidetes bacterium GWC2_33_15]OFX66498.1 MAG: DNA polymerase III subunit beta [Bacteroidetes bacterium GWB2_32_14]OFX70277.1 MAG: DNA polymerase III subunit beta [Bacteroidetes bacterium GWD2_33_33]HAN17274.1 DNA polymerase III subunit beta [Bacteroidales bacterium]